MPYKIKYEPKASVIECLDTELGVAAEAAKAGYLDACQDAEEYKPDMTLTPEKRAKHQAEVLYAPRVWLGRWSELLRARVNLITHMEFRNAESETEVEQ